MHIEGELPPAPRLAIVGSRAARRWALELVPALVAAAGATGHALVSGGAIGVDAAAHRAALAVGVPQVAVLPLGADRPYPPHHAPLFEALRADPRNAIVHGQAPGTPPTRGMFASRNRIVVSLCVAVVVVQAGLRSGTLGTGRLALGMGRKLAVLPGSAGAGQLAAEGATWLPGPKAGAEAVQAAAQAWLAGRESFDPRAPTGAPVPEHLAPFVEQARRAGARGITADDCDVPLLALAGLAEAEACGLLTAVGAGRYVLGPGAGRGADQGGDGGSGGAGPRS